jgi:Ca2+-binding RTX toxin-like protein
MYEIDAPGYESIGPYLLKEGSIIEVSGFDADDGLYVGSSYDYGYNIDNDGLGLQWQDTFRSAWLMANFCTGGEAYGTRVNGELNFGNGSTVEESKIIDVVAVLNNPFYNWEGASATNDASGQPFDGEINFGIRGKFRYVDLADGAVNAGSGPEGALGDKNSNNIVGTDGYDQVKGFGGNDTLNGGAGEDELLGGFGDDDIYGGVGNDSLSSTSGSNTLDGGDGFDLLIGGIDDDELIGGAGNDILIGDATTQVAGGDVLDGGAGDDLMEGGAGSDTFVFRPNEGGDTIGAIDLNYDDPSASTISGTDFESGVDVIALSGFGFADGSEAFAAVSNVNGVATFSEDGTTITFAGLTTADLTDADFFIL